MTVTRGRARATAAAGSTIEVLTPTSGLVADCLVRLLRGAGVVAGEGEEHLVQGRLVHAYRGDRHSGLPKPDEHVGGAIGDREGNGEPTGPRRQDRFLADHSVDDPPR
jgi:hypothetical protein